MNNIVNILLFLWYLEYFLTFRLFNKDPDTLTWFKRTNQSFSIAPSCVYLFVGNMFFYLCCSLWQGLAVLLSLAFSFSHTHTHTHTHKELKPVLAPCPTGLQAQARYLSLSAKDGVLCRVCLLSSWAMERGIARERGGGRWERLRS